MITVLFATRDRADNLQRMLDALLAMQPPDCGWKLVVADNGSRDATAAVLRSYASRLPLSVVFEPLPGKNRALNRALPCVEGDLVVLTDDDIIPDPDWLVRMREAAVAQPAATVFGGTVIPLWPDSRPAFISERILDFSMLFAQNKQPSGWCKPEAIFGPNMAVRGSVFADGFKFSEDIGPNGALSAYVMGSETDFLRRLGEAGHRAWFVAQARVRHIVRPEQLTETWILKRYYLWGLSIQRRGWVRGSDVVGRRIISAAAAAVARLLPQSRLRLWILSRDRVFAGVLAAAATANSATAHSGATATIPVMTRGWRDAVRVFWRRRGVP